MSECSGIRSRYSGAGKDTSVASMALVRLFTARAAMLKRPFKINDFKTELSLCKIPP